MNEQPQEVYTLSIYSVDNEMRSKGSVSLEFDKPRHLVEVARHSVAVGYHIEYIKLPNGEFHSQKVFTEDMLKAFALDFGITDLSLPDGVWDTSILE